MTKEQEILLEIRNIKSEVEALKHYMYTDKNTGQEGAIAQLKTNENRISNLEKTVKINLGKMTVAIAIFSAIGGMILAINFKTPLSNEQMK